MHNSLPYDLSRDGTITNKSRSRVNPIVKKETFLCVLSFYKSR